MKPQETPEPFTDQPKFYLYRMFAAPMKEWEMLTGMSREVETPEQMAEAFKQTVRKKITTGTEQERTAFGHWMGANTQPPTQAQQTRLEEMLRAGNFGLDVGAIFEGVDEEAKDASLQVEYFVLADPEVVSAVTPPAAPIQAGALPVLPFWIGFGLAGLVTASLVKEGTGLKVMAGTAGGLMGGLAVAQLMMIQEGSEV